MMVRLFWLVTAAYCCCCFVCHHVIAAESLSAPQQRHQPPPPNILLLLTDDQDVVVGGMAHMPILQKMLKERGVTFANAFCHSPICCPSRSSILSGRYLHNGGAIDNHVTGNCNGLKWQQGPEQTAFAPLLQQLGYRTSHAGKYLNTYGASTSPDCSKQYNCRRVPPGWERWLGLTGNNYYYNYSVVQSLDGGTTTPEIIHHGEDYDRDYLPDLVANFTLDSIREFTASDSRQPFLIVAAWPTPHEPFTPAPWAQNRYSHLDVMKTPNYNASWESLQTKHWMMRDLAPIDDETQAWMNQVYQNRTEALQSVDRHIAQFIQALEDAGVYENTFIVYTSDNGYQLGQHRLSYDKRQLYENDLRVPFVVTGPGVPMNVTNSAIVLNIDLAPSFVDMALSSTWREDKEQTEVASIVKKAVVEMDGTSFLPAIFGPNNHTTTTTFRTDFLVSYHGAGKAQCDNFYKCPPPKLPGDPNYHTGDWTNNTYHCVRTLSGEEDSIYCRFLDDADFVEYYDIAQDRWQLHNAYSSLSLVQRSRYERRLEQLRTCRGKSCRQEQQKQTRIEAVA